MSVLLESRLLVLLTLLLLLSLRSVCLADEIRRDFVYIAAAAVGAFPEDRDAVFQDHARFPTMIRSGAGLGVKAAVFPGAAGRVVGLELESMGHSGRVQFPVAPNGAVRSASSSLTVFTTMANLVMQYPDSRLMPYVGFGLGWATGVLTDTDIPQRPDRGLEGSSAFSYQVLAGVRARVSDRIFVFTEYKRLTAQFHWTQLALDFRAHYALLGLGYTF